MKSLTSGSVANEGGNRWSARSRANPPSVRTPSHAAGFLLRAPGMERWGPSVPSRGAEIQCLAPAYRRGWVNRLGLPRRRGKSGRGDSLGKCRTPLAKRPSREDRLHDHLQPPRQACRGPCVLGRGGAANVVRPARRAGRLRHHRPRQPRPKRAVVRSIRTTARHGGGQGGGELPSALRLAVSAKASRSVAEVKRRSRETHRRAARYCAPLGRGAGSPIGGPSS